MKSIEGEGTMAKQAIDTQNVATSFRTQPRRGTNHIPHRFERIQLEPTRDWSFGFLSGHRLRIVSYLIIGIVALYILQSWFWPTRNTPETIIGHVWSWGSLLWLGAVIPGICGLTGM